MSTASVSSFSRSVSAPSIPLRFVSFLVVLLVSVLSQSLLPLSFLPPTSSSTIICTLSCSASRCLFSLILSLLLSISTNVSLPASFPSLFLLCLCYLSWSTITIEKGRGLCKCKSAQKVTKIIRMALRVIS
jgi:hypothetical protein